MILFLASVFLWYCPIELFLDLLVLLAEPECKIGLKMLMNFLCLCICFDRDKISS